MFKSFPSTHVPLLIPPYCSVHASLICEDPQHKSHGVKEKTTTIKVFPGRAIWCISQSCKLCKKLSYIVKSWLSLTFIQSINHLSLSQFNQGLIQIILQQCTSHSTMLAMLRPKTVSLGSQALIKVCFGDWLVSG